jgi:Undecaprenyl-phosphate glucose phosphotransferase
MVLGRSVDHEVAQQSLKSADFAVLFVLAFGVTMASFIAPNPDTRSASIFIALFVSLFCVMLIRTLGAYLPHRWNDFGYAFGWPLFAITFTGLLGQIVSSVTYWALKPSWIATWCIVGAGYFLVSRLGCFAWARAARARGGFKQRIAIVGGGQAAEDALNLLSKDRTQGIEILGLFDDRSDDRSPDSIQQFQKIGRISDLNDFARRKAVDLIIVAIPMTAEKRLLKILKSLWELPVDIRISAASSELRLSPKAYTYLGDLPLLSVFERPLRGWDAVLKDAVDKVLALIALVAFSPLMLIVAVAIRYDSKGPILFKQKRHGFNNELIEVYKFRSMYTDMSDATASKLVTKDDPRVTPVGRFIRRTSIDELPQLLNVLKGELSMVGPRPHATHAKAAGTLYNQVVDGYFARHKVKPGITGWAQINGWRGETDTKDKLEQRVKHDLEYIDRWSLALDLYILAKTPFSLIKNENAY